MPRSDAITFRVSPEERTALEAEAAAADRSLGWVIRSKLFPTLRAHATTSGAISSSGASWPPSPHPDAKPGTVLTSSGPLTVTAMDTPSATSPDRRAKAEPLDVRNSSQKAQSARDELLRGMGGKKK